MAIYLIEQEEAVPTWKLYRNGVVLGTIERVAPPRQITRLPYLATVQYGSEASRRMGGLLEAGRWLMCETARHRAKMRERGRAKRRILAEGRI